MNTTLRPFAACALILAPNCAPGATLQVFDKLVNTEIPDNNDSGLSSLLAVAGVGQSFTSVEVVVNTQGGWNGDLYAYLEHNGVISVLLNRPGRTAGNPAGAASGGMQLRFADTAPSDIHTAISGTFGTLATGTYQPDARDVDPALVTDDASFRNLYLAGFNGQNADGEWTLFVADLSGGDVATLSNWSITFVPEPSSALLLCAALPVLLRRRRASAK